jgi:hypothetical protein
MSVWYYVYGSVGPGPRDASGWHSAATVRSTTGDPYPAGMRPGKMQEPSRFPGHEETSGLLPYIYHHKRHLMGLTVAGTWEMLDRNWTPVDK